MFSSRCGVRCDLCERKEAVHCRGCIHMDKPFWGGVCEVKSCVESKHLEVAKKRKETFSSINVSSFFSTLFEKCF